MYATHQKQIGSFARQDAGSMATVYAFVLATIQQSLWQTPTIMDSIRREGIESRFLWGFKYDAYEFITENEEAVYEIAMAIYNGHADPTVQALELLRYFSSLPGLGVVKGGFMVQLCFGMAGCIDSHNMRIFEVDPYQFKASRYKAAKRGMKDKILHEYFDLIHREGGSCGLWDRWCEYVAKRSPERYDGAYSVSELHVTAIGV